MATDVDSQTIAHQCWDVERYLSSFFSVCAAHCQRCLSSFFIEEEVAKTHPALLLQNKPLLPTPYQPPRKRKERNTCAWFLRSRKENCGKPCVGAYCKQDDVKLSEAIQNLPPELREIICEGYVAIKQREREALGWTKVHEHILKLPFCHLMQQIVPTVVVGWTKAHEHILKLPFCHFMQQIVPTVVDSYPYNPFYEGCCYPCLNKEGGRGMADKVTMNPPIEAIDLTKNFHEYEGFLKGCYWNGNCFDCYDAY